MNWHCAAIDEVETDGHRAETVNNRIRIAIVADHPLFREGVARVLSLYPDLEVVAQGATGQDAVLLAVRRAPDILILDLDLPGGRALQALAGLGPETRAVLLVNGVEDVAEAWHPGTYGYIVKGTTGQELAQAVRAVAQGERYLSPALGAQLIAERGQCRHEPNGEGVMLLSQREAEILALVKQGLSNKVIGSRLGLSDRTIKHYMGNLFQKLRVRTRLEAALHGQSGAPFSPA
jgi:two-component system nitrate/nitrite response regulator NarL